MIMRKPESLHPNVLCVGSTVVDLPGNGSYPHGVPGGSALNVAVAVRRQGPDAALLTALGSDEAGEAVERFLSLETIALLKVPINGTIAARADIKDGTASYTFTTTRPSGQFPLGPAELRMIRKSGTVVLSAYRAPSPCDLDRLAEVAAHRAGRLIYDPNPRYRDTGDTHAHRRQVEELGPHCDLLKLSDEDAGALFGEPGPDIARRFLDAGTGAVLITHGRGGATLHTRDFAVCNSTYVERLLDPRGAGDCVLATIAAAVADARWPSDPVVWDRIMQRAMRAAAVACSREGGAVSMPTAAEISAHSEETPV